MYRYLVFTGSSINVAGGMDDCTGKFNSFTDAIIFLIKFENKEWFHIYDVKENQIIDQANIEEIMKEIMKVCSKESE